MNETQPLVQFPVPSPLTLAVLTAGFVLVIAAIVMREVLIRRRALRARLDREWESVGNILAERRIEGGDADLLKELIGRTSKREPLRAVTTREGFDAMVEAEMARNAKLDTHAFDDLGVRLRGLRKELGLDYVPVGHAIRSTRDLHDGQWMTIAPADADPPDWTRVMVEDVNEAFIYVMLKDAPASRAPALPAGARIRCTLWKDEDARYAFVTTVATHSAPPPAWRLFHTGDLDRTQNRADFRVRHDHPVVAGVLNAPRDGDATDLNARPIVTRISGRITSLSAGGCALVFSQPVARHVLLRIELDVPGVPTRDVEIKIVSTAAISGGRYLVRGRFLGLDIDTRDKIARYVLHKQQQRLAAQAAKG